MVRLGKCRVFIDFRDRFAILQHFLETEKVPVDTLAIGGPRGVLEMTRDSTAEKDRPVFVLKGDIKFNRIKNC
jgi:hypothetical protein